MTNLASQEKFISVIAIFHNMRREAERTLYSLTTAYQTGAINDRYEVIAIDSNSTECLSSNLVQSFGNNFSYQKVTSKYPSPCIALNKGVELARGNIVMCLIDGARILSPSIISKTLLAFETFNNPFVYTIGLHLGPKIQNISITEGYDKTVEDKLLDSVDWKINGYSLFNISVLAGSNKGYNSKITESNCFSLYKKSYYQIGGFDERFISPGGGLANLDIFNRAMESESIDPVLLMGEGSFHQLHGGVATNVQREIHPYKVFNEEYRNIKGQYFHSSFRPPHYFGDVSHESKKFI